MNRINTKTWIWNTTLVACLVLTSTGLAQEIPGPPQRKPILLTNATIHPVSKKKIENGSLLFNDGKIVALGNDLSAEGAEVIDLAGKHVYPGMIESHSRMGLTEIAAVRATNDYRESGTLNPNVKALVSVYPDNVIIPVTRSNGILFALTAPTGGLISGKSAVIQLDGWTYQDMAIREAASLQINWPSQEIPARFRARLSESDIKKRIEEQAKRLDQLVEFFDHARRYRDQRASDSALPFDARLESMIDVVNGKLPLMIAADRAADIQSAIAFGAKQKLKVIILGGYDAEQCADALKANNVPVIISAVQRMPIRRDDPYDRAYSLPARLHAAGVKFCISSTNRSETWNARVLPYQASTAIGFGLPAEEALKSVTLYAAQILGVEDRIGSLDVGKDASLIVTDGDPLETITNVEMAFLQGRRVDLSNRQKRLYKKYQQKYKQ